MLIALIFLAGIITVLTTLIRQRLSVPELSKQKIKNSLILFFGFLAIFCLVMIFIFNNFSTDLSRKIGFVDNIFNVYFMLSAFIFCFFTFDILNKLSWKEKPLNFFYIYYKKFLLICMFTQKVCYMFNFVLISFYNPMINSEKILLSAMVFTINLNCIVYYFMFAMFVYSMKYDLCYVNMQLEVIPDLEFFVDENEDMLLEQIGKII